MQIPQSTTYTDCKNEGGLHKAFNCTQGGKEQTNPKKEIYES